MRHIWPLAALVALTACSKEPDFDERYARANEEIEIRVKALDAAAAQEEAAQAVEPAIAAPPALKMHLPVGHSGANAGGSSGE